MATDRDSFANKELAIDQDEIDPRSRSIAEKRAIGLTHRQSAELHGVSAKTVARTLERPEIQELVSTLQAEMYSESTARLLSLSEPAVETLERLMGSESDSVALRAASKVIDMAGPLAAHRVMEERLAKLVAEIESRLEDV